MGNTFRGIVNEMLSRFSDCENLIRHMLVVDVNKRYTINQIKRDRWIIQGEPYDFLEEEEEFNDPVSENSSENEVVLDEEIFEQTCQMLRDEEPVKIQEVSLFLPSSTEHY